MLSNSGKFRDTTPDQIAAGKLFDQGGSAAEIIRSHPLNVSYVLL